MRIPSKLPGTSHPQFCPRKSKKSIVNFKVLKLVGDMGLILIRFQIWFVAKIKILVKLIWFDNVKISGFPFVEGSLHTLAVFQLSLNL